MLIALLLLLAGCPSSDPADPPPEPVQGLVPVGEVLDGERLPQTLDGDSFDVSLVAGQILLIDADNDQRAGDLYVVVFDSDGDAVAGPGVLDFRFEYLNADWACSFEPANHPPDRPRGCPSNTFVADAAGIYTLVIAAHDGDEPTVGYSLTAESEGVGLTLHPR